MGGRNEIEGEASALSGSGSTLSVSDNEAISEAAATTAAVLYINFNFI
jgi:hypothetical protein